MTTVVRRTGGRQWFAHIKRFDLANDVQSILNQIGKSMQQHGSIVCPHRCPTGTFKCLCSLYRVSDALGGHPPPRSLCALRS